MIKKIAKNGKIFGIIAVIVAGISFIVPVMGVFLACFLGTLLVALSLKEGAVLGYVAGGLNIINVAFLSPSVMISGAVGGQEIYWFYVCCAILGPVLLFILNKQANKK
tara:strand:- start:369 stop:692 length:324 start_codon:yes stop_codon:yes gene_type:complete